MVVLGRDNSVITLTPWWALCRGSKLKLDLDVGSDLGGYIEGRCRTRNSGMEAITVRYQWG